MNNRRNKLRALLAVVVPIVAFVVLVIICYIVMPHLNADTVSLNLYCDDISLDNVPATPSVFGVNAGYTMENYTDKSPKISTFFTNVHHKFKISQIALLIEFVPMEPTDDVVTDAEIYLITFRKNGNQIKNVAFAYDFYLKNTYAYFDGEWYFFKENFAFEKLISLVWDEPFDCKFRGQSIYSDGDSELFCEASDFDSLTFRYDLRWSMVENLKDKNSIDYEYRDSGFKNVGNVRLENAVDAVAQAAYELGYLEYVGVAFYDKTNGYWMVEIHENTEQLKEAREDDARYYELLYENVYTVIIDNTATTLEIYKSCTTFLQFAYAGIIGGKA